MFYDAHYLFPRAWTQEQSAPSVPENAPLAIYGQNRVSQPFVSGADNLAMVEIWLAGEPDETVNISLHSDLDQLFEGEQILTWGRQGGLYRFSFPPNSDAEGEIFLLTLSAPEATVENPVVTRTVGGDRLGGSLLLNEYNQPGNLALASYSRGWPGFWWLETVAEQILPDLLYLRLQQYKPDPFKGYFFSLVLLITILLSVMYLLLAQPQKRLSIRRLQASLGWTVALILSLFLLWQIGAGRVKLPVIHDSLVLNSGVEAIAVAAPPGSGTRLARDIISDLWTLEREPEARFLHTEIFDGFPAIRVPHDSAISFNIDVAPETYLLGGIIADGTGNLDVNVQVEGENVYFEGLTAEPDPNRENIAWFEIDLSPWAGQGVTVELKTTGDIGEVEGIWIMPRIETNAPWIFSEPLPDSINLSGQEVIFDETVEMLGSSVQETNVQAGETVTIDLFWRPVRNSEQFAKVFVHLLDPDDNLLVQSDGQPVQNAYPIPIWQPGTIIRDTHSLTLPPDLSPGEYRLFAGLYDPGSLVRWPANAAEGSTIINDAVLLQPRIEVNP